MVHFSTLNCNYCIQGNFALSLEDGFKTGLIELYIIHYLKLDLCDKNNLQIN